jgi:ATP-dependent exoDNAse (exonuclease V) beta subunit
MLERESRQEMERLLYVALTRARHTLVLAFDNELFAKKSGEIHSHSQSKWLKADKGQSNAVAFANIATDPTDCSLTSRQHETKSKGRDQIESKLPAGKIDKTAAIKNASIFVRKLNPSGLPGDEIEERWSQNEPVLSPRPASPALRYGLWWHDFVQRLPWKNGSSDWDKLFEEYRKLSPDPARSAREWKLLLDHLSSGEDFRRDFSGTDSITHSEVPFFWRVDSPSRTGGTCLEGVVDLALFQSAARKCFILDWKTDRVPPDNTKTLHARYRPQLAAYWKAVSEMTKMEVAAAIYSTAAGALVRYETEELASDWKRLIELPPEKLAAVIMSDKPKSSSAQLEFSDFA